MRYPAQRPNQGQSSIENLFYADTPQCELIEKDFDRE